jgi:uncharacterized phage protein gp47/JayE
MSITTTGYSIKRYVDVIAEIRQELITASGNPNLDLSDDSILGIINNIYALKLSELHELAQAQWSAGDLDSATGIALDRIVARGRVTRLSEQKAYGDLHFTDSLGKTINSGTQVKDLAGNVVQTLSQITLDTSGIVGCTLNITAVNGFTYSITINATTYQYVSDGTATVTEILNGLIVALSSNTSLTTSIDTNRLSIQSTSAFNIIVGTNLSVHQVTKGVSGEALVASDEVFEAGTLSYPVTVIGSTSVTNRQNWVSGRTLETDAQLRNRFKNSVGGQGNATVPAIRARLTALDGVTSASVEENWTLSTSVTGLPAKSFEATVKGGSDVAVATAIWESKPAGIQPYGLNNANITDSEGRTQTIYFTRPVDQYIHVNVLYSIYSEEIFPSNGPSMIANAIKNYGDSLGVNEDVIPQRLMAAVYQNVAGISNLVITAGKTASPFDTPVYSSGVIAIGRKEESIFDLSRIVVAAA